MKNAKKWTKPLLWMHLIACLAWWIFFRRLYYGGGDMPEWVVHVVVWSILGVQFTWGFTIGLLVGPARKNRGKLWWSLLTIFLPLWFMGALAHIIFWSEGLLLATVYLAFFVIILASETYCGVLAGVRAHAQEGGD